VALIWGWMGRFDLVRGSTEAWIVAHVQRVLLAGDYAAASGAGMIPNTTWNPLYPALLAASSWALGCSPAVAGHVLAAASLGLAAAALAHLWRRAAGAVPATLAGLAVFLPPVFLTATMVRYDLPALALALGCACCALRALERGGWLSWILAGLLAGLAYNTREFVGAPAGGCLVLALGLHLWLQRPRQRLRATARAVLATAGGLVLGVVPLPLALGLSPLGGLGALMGFSLHNEFGSQRSVAQVLQLSQLWVALMVGLLGLLAAAVFARSPARRRAALLIWGLLLPCGVFFLSKQQSPQYYLLPQLLVAAGAAGLAALPPRRWQQGLLVGLGALLLLPWALVGIASGLGDRPPGPGLHSEAWPCAPQEPAQVMDWALERAADAPLVAISGKVENLDALSAIHHGRPVAFLFREWADRLQETVEIYEGGEVLLLTVEGQGMEPVLPQEGELLDELRTPTLRALLFRLPGAVRQGSLEPPCARGGQIRGACLQVEWLAGGQEAVRERMLELARERQGLQGPGRMWW